MANTNLANAKTAKNDEFYTQYPDIQKEINAYLDYNPDVFRGKTVLLPCDDPEWSNFSSPAKTCVGTIFVVHPYMDSAYKLLASHILPKEISESFDLVDVTSDKLPGNSHDMLHLYLDEKPIPPDNRTDLTPNGFYPESTALDFPIREYTTVLHVR